MDFFLTYVWGEVGRMAKKIFQNEETLLPLDQSVYSPFCRYQRKCLLDGSLEPEIKKTSQVKDL